MSTLGRILAGLGFIGIFSELVYSATIVYDPTAKAKLTQTDWGLKIYMPTIIFLTLILIGMYIIFNNNDVSGIDDKMYITLIVFMCAGNIAVSSLIIIFSLNVINWKSD